MNGRTSHWKVGVFVLVVAGAVIASVITLGECTSHPRTVAFVTYFDESVGGLGTGTRVEFRGVTIGTISRIAIASDHRHIEVGLGLDADALTKIGITAEGGGHVARYSIPPDLRAQIGGNGLTGVKNVVLDLLDPQSHPPPALPFPAPANYIPAAPSTMANLESALAKAADRVPELADSLLKASQRAEGLLADVERKGVPDKTAAALEHADRALAALDTTVRRLDRARVPERASKTLDDASAALAKMQRVLEGLSGSTRDVGDALDELRDTAEAIRVLAEDIDRDPDMLLKGRATRGLR